MKFPLISCASLLLLAACQSALPAGDTVGMPIVVQEIHTLAEVDASPSDYFEQTLLVEARITAVCQSKGCWMKVEDDGHSAMVRWEEGCGGQFAFPASAVGQRVIIQGSFYPKAISEEDAQHLKSEAADGVTFEREGYEFNASAVIICEE
ncbi:MAG: hypothetical protein ACI8QS_003384 [Planctomycetota bacterium]|jgi:hypothetical protein